MMCDDGKDRFGGRALRIILAEKGAAGQISLRSTAVVKHGLLSTGSHWKISTVCEVIS